MKRSAPLTRTPLRSRRAPKRTRRPAAERERIYGSAERIEFVKSLPCIWCGATPSENAHVGSKSGMGRKGDACTIVPLCGAFQNGCHRAYDEHRAPFDNAGARRAVRGLADEVERHWQARSGGPEHISSVVAKGGLTVEKNLQTLCSICNGGKSDRAPHPHDLRAP